MKMKYKIGIVCLLLLLIPFAQAASKPIAGRLEFTNGIERNEVNLYVRVDSPVGGETVCTVNPIITNGPDGSFSTNLANLVLQEFPSVRCDGFWKIGDDIWYEVASGGSIWKSETEQIASGTGLQWLESLIVNNQEGSESEHKRDGSEGGASSSSSSSSSGSGSSDNSVMRGEFAGDSSTLPNKGEPINENEFSLDLSLNQQEGVIRTAIIVDGKTGAEIIIRLVLFSLPNNNIIRTIEEQFFSEGRMEKSISFTTGEMDSGHYKLQVFAYVNNELIAVSNVEEFFTEGGTSKIQLPRTGLVGRAMQLPAELGLVQGISFGLVAYGVSFFLVLSALLLFVRKKKMRSAAANLVVEKMESINEGVDNTSSGNFQN